MQIFVDENIPQGREAFTPHGEVTLFHGRQLQADALKQADALIVRSITKVNKNLLEASPIQFVGTATIGTDHVDQAYLASRNIAFSSAPGCNANSVAEYVLSALSRLHVDQGFTWQQKTLGIVGYGHVGKKLAAKAKILGIRILLCDPPLQEAGLDHETYYDLSMLLEECDIISLHVPLTRTGAHPTLRMIHNENLSLIQKPLILFNSCRGEVIEEKALFEAKQKGMKLFLNYCDSSFFF